MYKTEMPHHHLDAFIKELPDIQWQIDEFLKVYGAHEHVTMYEFFARKFFETPIDAIKKEYHALEAPAKKAYRAKYNKKVMPVLTKYHLTNYVARLEDPRPETYTKTPYKRKLLGRERRIYKKGYYRYIKVKGEYVNIDSLQG